MEINAITVIKTAGRKVIINLVFFLKSQTLNPKRVIAAINWLLEPKIVQNAFQTGITLPLASIIYLNTKTMGKTKVKKVAA